VFKACKALKEMLAQKDLKALRGYRANKARKDYRVLRVK
jgi:hypothetical protein